MDEVPFTVVTPDAYKTDALVLANGWTDFAAGKTDDPDGTVVTHWVASGMGPEATRDAFEADPRFTVSRSLNWRALLSGWLFNVNVP